MSIESGTANLTTVQIGDKEYKIDELPDEAKPLIQSIQFTNAELLRAQALVAVLMTAKARYEDLRKIIEPAN